MREYAIDRRNDSSAIDKRKKEKIPQRSTEARTILRRWIIPELSISRRYTKGEKNFSAIERAIERKGKRERVGEHWIKRWIKSRMTIIALPTIIRATISFSHSSLDPIFDHRGKRATCLEYKHSGSKKFEKTRKF